MAVIPAALGEPQLQNCWFRGFRHHFTFRCVRKPDTCRHSIGVPSISVLSNSHSVINTNHGPNKLSEWKKHVQTTDCCHTFVLVNCIETYIYRRLIGLQMGKCGIQPLLLALCTKL